MRIALATAGTTGDVLPFVALARALIDAGHTVTAVSWPVHRELLTVPGVRFVAAGPHATTEAIRATAERAAAERNPIRQVEVLRDFHLEGAAAHYRTLIAALDGHDLVVLHGVHSLAHAAALDLDAPWATVVFDPVLLPTASAPPAGVPNLGPLNRVAWWMLDRMLARTGGPLDAALVEAGSPQRGLPLFRARSPLLHLVACSPSIIRVAPDLPATTHVTGAWSSPGPPRPLPPEVEEFLAAGELPIIVSFGSMTGSDLPAVLAATDRLCAEGRRVVLDGADSAPDRPGALAVRGLDHRALFPRASLVVHHGGAGTTHTACAAGVPNVVVPHIGDQPYWADRVRRLGVGPPAVDARSLTPDRLVRAIELARTDLAMRERANQLGRRLRGEDGIGAAVGLIEAAAG